MGDSVKQLERDVEAARAKLAGDLAVLRSPGTFSDMTETFLRAYRKAYGEDEKPDDAVALGFDAYLLALRAIEDAGTYKNGSLIAGKLSSVFEMPAATGSITLNAQGDPIKEVVIERFVKAEPKPVFTAVPSWGQ